MGLPGVSSNNYGNAPATSLAHENYAFMICLSWTRFWCLASAGVDAIEGPNNICITMGPITELCELCVHGYVVKCSAVMPTQGQSSCPCLGFLDRMVKL
eukprot:scaffold112936_cov17-Prasinocladus_malaysianus.AAC.2